LVAPATTKFQYTDGVRDVSRIDPDNWSHDQALLDQHRGFVLAEERLEFGIERDGHRV